MLKESLARMVDISPDEIDVAFDNSTNTDEFIENLEYGTEEQHRDFSQFQNTSLRLFYNTEVI